MTETRNIIDYYHYWKNEAIIADLDKKRHKFGVLISNINYDFNISTVIRNSNAFLAKMTYIYGRKKWDKRGAVGTHNYVHLKHIPENSSLLDGLKDEYVLIGIDNLVDSVPMDEFDWPENALMCFGQEQIGLPKDIIDKCDKIVYIKQFGSVRSLNVGCASAIAMYDYCKKNGGH